MNKLKIRIIVSIDMDPRLKNGPYYWTTSPNTLFKLYRNLPYYSKFIYY